MCTLWGRLFRSVFLNSAVSPSVAKSRQKLKARGLQRDVVYLGWPIAPSNMSPNAGGGGELRGLSQWVQLYTGSQINFGDLTPHLTYAESLRIQAFHKMLVKVWCLFLRVFCLATVANNGNRVHSLIVPLSNTCCLILKKLLHIGMMINKCCWSQQEGEPVRIIMVTIKKDFFLTLFSAARLNVSVFWARPVRAWELHAWVSDPAPGRAGSWGSLPRHPGSAEEEAYFC